MFAFDPSGDAAHLHDSIAGLIIDEDRGLGEFVERIAQF